MRLDIVVANAGGGTFATLEQLTPDEFDQTFSSNVRGTVFTVQKAVPLLNDGASIVVTGSTSPPRATNAFGGYSASKAAIAQFVRVGAIELADRRIRVINRAAGRRCCARAPLNQIAGHGPEQYFGGTGRARALGSFCAQTRLPDPSGVQAVPPYPPPQHPWRGRGRTHL